MLSWRSEKETDELIESCNWILQKKGSMHLPVSQGSLVGTVVPTLISDIQYIYVHQFVRFGTACTQQSTWEGGGLHRLRSARVEQAQDNLLKIKEPPDQFKYELVHEPIIAHHNIIFVKPTVLISSLWLEGKN